MWVKPQEYKKLGVLLGSARSDAGLTQQDVADRLKKPQSFVSSYESGQRRIDVLEFVQICSAIGLDPAKSFAQLMKIL